MCVLCDCAVALQPEVDTPVVDSLEDAKKTIEKAITNVGVGEQRVRNGTGDKESPVLHRRPLGMGCATVLLYGKHCWPSKLRRTQTGDLECMTQELAQTNAEAFKSATDILGHVYVMMCNILSPSKLPLRPLSIHTDKPCAVPSEQQLPCVLSKGLGA